MDKAFIQLLACPKCKGKIISVGKARLRCSNCNIYYSVKHGIPVMVDLKHLPEHLRGQVSYFNAEAKSYGISYTMEDWQKKYIERIFRQVDRIKGKILVDDACGSGYVTIEAAKRGVQVIACDLNLVALTRLRRLAQDLELTDRVFLVCCSSEALPIRSASADLIVANAILEHLPNEKEAIADITRISKKGAVAMITVPIAYYLLNPLFLVVNYLHDKRIGHLRRYTKESILGRFRGWKFVTLYYTGHTVKVLKTLVNQIAPIFDPRNIEQEDERRASQKLFATNVSVLLRKQ